MSETRHGETPLKLLLADGGPPRRRRGGSRASSRRARTSAASPVTRMAWAWSRPTRARCCSRSGSIAARARCASARSRAPLLREGEEADYRGAVLGRRLVLRHRLPCARPQERGPPAVAASCVSGAADRRRHRRGARSRTRWVRFSAPIRSWPRTTTERLDQAERGIDVEGVAVRGGAVLLGLRSPCLDGQAFVLEVALADLFEHDPDARPRYGGMPWRWARPPASAISPRCRTACWC